MTWLPPDDAPCRDADPELFHPPATTPEAILPPLMEYCRFCSDQAGCLRRGMELHAWGVWGGVGLKDGKPTRQPSAWAKRTYKRRKQRSEANGGSSGQVSAESA